ncbi:helix-turn-helix domain-containing protein [Paenibacillus sp. y28]|uniref:helix-turn-helix domain-containing protein n=1 Tax=Paenibacillus sp. y28 TaxID=3129110 RepID=UPI0030178204
MIVKPRLGEILKERDMTQTALAEKAGIPQAAISRFDKSGQHKDEHLFLIARALGLGVEELFEVEDD